MNRVLLVVLGGVLAVSGVGCDDNDDAEGVPVAPVRQGDIGAVTFTYGCAGAGDAQCNVDSDLAPVAKDSAFPPLVVGGSFLVTTTWNGTDAPPSGPLVPSGAGDTFFTVDTATAGRTVVRAQKEGRGAFLALSGTQIVDLTTLEVRAFHHVKVLQASPRGDFKDGSIDLDLTKGTVTAAANVQYTFKFRAVPADAQDELLVGQLPVTWSSLDPNIVKITSAPDENVATFVSGAAGETKVHVVVGDRSADIAIKVGG